MFQVLFFSISFISHQIYFDVSTHLVRKVDFSFLEDLDVLAEVVVGVDVHPVEGPDAVEREHQVQGFAVQLLLPAEPVVAWKEKRN